MKKTRSAAWFCLASIAFFSCTSEPGATETFPVSAGGPAESQTPRPQNAAPLEHGSQSPDFQPGARSGGTAIPETGAGPVEGKADGKTDRAAGGGEAPDETRFDGIETAALPYSSAGRPPAGRAGANESSAPERTGIPPIPEYIMGKGLIAPETMAAFLMRINPEAEKEAVLSLAAMYAEEAALEGVNHDAAFAQMCLETGFLRFGGLVSPEMNNFCGLGAVGPDQRGESFPDPRTGIRAHIQHLKAYATEEPLNQELVDPRYFWVRYGSSPEIKGLSGSWAADAYYAEKINRILERLYRFSFGT